MSQIKDYDIYERHKRLSNWNQSVITKLKVVVVGLGGLGSELLKSLVLIGVNYFILIDNDNIEPSNLSRLVYADGSNVKQPKVKIASRWIKKIKDKIEVIQLNNRIEELSLDYFTDIDIIFSCLDNNKARTYINKVAVALNKKLIDAGSEGHFGHIQIIIPGVTECYDCQINDTNIRKYVPPCDFNSSPKNWQDVINIELKKFVIKNGYEPDPSNIDEYKTISNNIFSICDKNKLNKPSDLQIRNYGWEIPASTILINSIIANYQLIFGLILSFNNKDEINKLIKTPFYQVQAWPPSILEFENSINKSCSVCSTHWKSIKLDSREELKNIFGNLDIQSLNSDTFIFNESKLLSIFRSPKELELESKIFLDIYVNNKHKKIILEIGDKI